MGPFIEIISNVNILKTLFHQLFTPTRTFPIITLDYNDAHLHYVDFISTYPAKWPSRLGLQNTPTASLKRAKTSHKSVLWPSRQGLQNTPTASLPKR